MEQQWSPWRRRNLQRWRGGGVDTQPGAPAAAVGQILRELCDGPRSHGHTHTRFRLTRRVLMELESRDDQQLSPSADSPEEKGGPRPSDPTHTTTTSPMYRQEGRGGFRSLSDLNRTEGALFEAHRGILKSALIGWRSDRGGSPSPSSMAVMPNDQTSQRAS